MLTKQTRKALEFCIKNHDDSFRKDGKTKYWQHPIEVGIVLFKESKVEVTEDYLSIAFLHDILEDTSIDFDTLKEEFNEKIAIGVLALTKDPDEKKIDYLERVLSDPNPMIVAIKFADRLANLREAAKLDNSKENKSFKKYYLRRTKKYFIPKINNSFLQKQFKLAWYELRDSYYGEEYFL